MSLDPISAISDLVGSVVSRIWPDKTEVEKQKFILEIQTELDKTQLLAAQAQTNTAEASSNNWFAQDWRPLIGYVCGLTFAWHYFIQPILVFIITISGHTVPTLPVLNANDLVPILLGMLGLGGIRAYENVKGS